MTKTEIAALEALLTRLKAPNCGCSHGFTSEELIRQVNEIGIEAVGRIYLDTWIIPAIERLLPGDQRDPKLAYELLRR